MALLRDMVFKARPTVQKLIDEEIKILNLKILKKITVKFDPFRDDVQHIRDFSYLIHSPKARASNLKLIIKTDVVTDRSEQTVTFDLTDGQKFIFKCANLKTLEMFKLMNEHITPLSPVEEEVKVLMTKTEKKKSSKQKKGQF